MRSMISRAMWFGAVGAVVVTLNGCGGGDSSSTETSPAGAGTNAATTAINSATGRNLPPGVPPDAKPGS